MRLTALAASTAAVVLLAGCGGSSSGTAAGGSNSHPVPQLRSMAELRAVFNAHEGVPRLIVLISPT